MRERGGGVRCPYCGSTKSAVKDSRKCGGYIRRRRRCLALACDSRFSSYEFGQPDGLEADDLDRAVQLCVRLDRMASRKRALVLRLIDLLTEPAPAVPS